MDKISVIVPCYNEEKTLNLYYNELLKVMEQMQNVSFEVIFVDDGSRDATLACAEELAARDGRVYFISFSRNFGKEAAMLAGMEYSTGDYVIISDADLQDPPALIPEMYNKIKISGADCIATARKTRSGEPPIRSAFAHLFYKSFNRLCRLNVVDGARDYRIMSRQMTDSILAMGEHNRFSKGIFSWVGFRTDWIYYENIERAAGETKWSFWKLLKYAFEGFVSYSDMLLRLPLYLSALSAIAALVLVIKNAAQYNLHALVLLMAAVILACQGLSGIYLSKIGDEAKNRPQYIAKATNFRSKGALGR